MTSAILLPRSQSAGRRIYHGEAKWSHKAGTDFLSQLRVGIGSLSKPADNGQESKCDNLRKSQRKSNTNLKPTGEVCPISPKSLLFDLL